MGAFHEVSACCKWPSQQHGHAKASRALLPATGRHHTSKVRPEADVIALQQFVHNLFHHRNIPSGWAERQKKRLLVISCATSRMGGGSGQAAPPQHPSHPMAPKHLRVLQKPQPWAEPPLFLSHSYFLSLAQLLAPDLHMSPTGLPGVLSRPGGWHRSLSRYFGSSSAAHPNSWIH